MKAKKSVYQSGGKMPVGAKKKMTDMEIAKANRMQMLTEERNTIRKYDPDALAAFDRGLKTKGYMVNKKPTKKMMDGGNMDDMYSKGGKVKNDSKIKRLEKLEAGLVARGSKAVDEGRERKADRLLGKAARVENRVIKAKEAAPAKKMMGGGKMDMYGMGGKMKKYLAGGQVKLDKNKDGKISGEDFKMMKKYQMGGKMPVEKKDSFVGKGLFPKDPTAKGGPTGLETLEGLTWQKSIEALKRRGVSMIDQAERPPSRKILGQGNTNILDNNYELTITKAKEYGVYDLAREEAVREYRKQLDKEKTGK